MATSDTEKVVKFVDTQLAGLLALNASHVAEIYYAVQTKLNGLRSGAYGHDLASAELAGWINDLELVIDAIGDDGCKLLTLIDVVRKGVELRLSRAAPVQPNRARRVLELGDCGE